MVSYCVSVLCLWGFSTPTPSHIFIYNIDDGVHGLAVDEIKIFCHQYKENTMLILDHEKRGKNSVIDSKKLKTQDNINVGLIVMLYRMKKINKATFDQVMESLKSGGDN